MPYRRLEEDQREWIVNRAKELGEVQGSIAVLRREFRERYGWAPIRQTMIYWRGVAFRRGKAVPIRGGVAVRLNKDDSAIVDELIHTGAFKSVDEVMHAAVQAIKEAHMNV